MTRDRRTPTSLTPVDDATIEQLVRDVADGWQMPPVRLDGPSWRERVRSPRARRIEAARDWFGRAGRAASAAVAVTVVAALAAVLITRTPSEAGKSPAPSANGTPGPTAAFTPLPRVLIDGELPSPSKPLVASEAGFALVDLETGKVTAAIDGIAFGSVMRRLPDGTLECLCVKTTNRVNGEPTDAEIVLERFEPSGAARTSVGLASISAEPDPRDGPIQERPVHLAFELAFSGDGRYGFIGWSARAHPVWRSGVIVVDLSTGRQISRLDLPDTTSGEGDTRRVQFAPRVVGNGGLAKLVLAREWYSWSPPESAGQNYRQETDVVRVDVAGDGSGVALARPVAVDAASCGQRVIRAGVAAPDSWWIACLRGSSNQVVVRRFDFAGQRLGESTAAGAAGVDGDMTAVSPDGSALYAWNPITAWLTRFDLATGETAQGRAASAAEPGPLAALGDWLAPVAAAKSFLLGSVVVSPDGRRVYALGVDPAAVDREVSGSSGIFAFDAGTLESVGAWPPTADFVSIAVSADGRFLYAAGLPGVDAAGTTRVTQPASITVFDTADGAVRLIAGQLSSGLLTFPNPVLE